MFCSKAHMISYSPYLIIFMLKSILFPNAIWKLGNSASRRILFEYQGIFGKISILKINVKMKTRVIKKKICKRFSITFSHKIDFSAIGIQGSSPIAWELTWEETSDWAFERYYTVLIPLRFRKVGRVWCDGAREAHWATYDNWMTPSKTEEVLKSPAFINLNDRSVWLIAINLNLMYILNFRTLQ